MAQKLAKQIDAAAAADTAANVVAVPAIIDGTEDELVVVAKDASHSCSVVEWSDKNDENVAELVKSTGGRDSFVVGPKEEKQHDVLNSTFIGNQNSETQE